MKITTYVIVIVINNSCELKHHRIKNYLIQLKFTKEKEILSPSTEAFLIQTEVNYTVSSANPNAPMSIIPSIYIFFFKLSSIYLGNSFFDQKDKKK